MTAALLAASAAGGDPAARPDRRPDRRSAAPPATRPAQVDETPSHTETDPPGEPAVWQFSRLTAMCLDKEGRLLACDGDKGLVKVITPAGTVSATWKVGFDPSAICAAPDGAVYVGGDGVIARLDAAGKVVKTVRAGEGGFPNGKVSDLAASDKDLFASIGQGWSLRSTAVIVRLDRDVKDAKTIATGLRGCCQRLDMAWHEGCLYVAENTRYRVVKYDREGRLLGSWGSNSRTGLEGFGACCNPMNIAIGPGGELYTAESGLGRVKRYTPEGKLLGLVGSVGTQRFTSAGRLAASCSNIALTVAADGGVVFVMDFQNNRIRLLGRAGKPAEPEKMAK